ncbi:hypothetical protein ANCCAN_15264 [Ancylostoma caninum]|uniref:Uncharacterized protein n=1 Tax=Ancylostoma caninum TaxID=29170 RepID=A0A368G6A1_ANCCA|nr:hypothetical protein ANCCAN_15264 [Ancylostoma caninum]
MGNQQTRKRPAEEAINLGQLKKARLSEAHSLYCSSNTRKRKSREATKNGRDTASKTSKRRFSNLATKTGNVTRSGNLIYFIFLKHENIQKSMSNAVAITFIFHSLILCFDGKIA